VDSQLRRKYQAEPGRQEWVTAVECISADGHVITPLIIFKGENLMNSWIPMDIVGKWKFACNCKGWTSNIHGEEWLKLCFDPATKGKAQGRYRLLICDGHDSHISAAFVRYAIDNRIVIFLLPPHSSHLLQPLDVGVFGPLKRAMSFQLSRLYGMEISRLQKIEWLEHYVQARLAAITEQNILGGWRGTGIFPRYSHRIIRQLTGISTPPPASEPTTRTLYLISSSPPDSNVLWLANTAFKDALRHTTLPSPVKKHGRKLSGIAERLHANNTILRRENAELKKVIKTRKERLSGKRIILKGQIVVSTEEIARKLADAERATEEKKAKPCQKKNKTAVRQQKRNNDELDEDSEAEEHEILDCIEVIVD